MDEVPAAFDSPETRSTIDHELELVDSAIDFVLAGGAARVTLAGLRFGREIMSRPSNLRLAGRVRLEPLWRFDSTGCDIAVLADG
jgi:hypothetical protein